MSWWENAYRSGHVNWDPGPYDGHLPWLLSTFDIQPCRALDIGCGDGKSAVWLAQQGFDVVGVDLAPTAIRLARQLARQRGVFEGAGEGRALFLRGVFPDDFTEIGRDADLRPASFDLVIERGFLQHFRSEPSLHRTLSRIARLLTPHAIFYSLIAAREGGGVRWGPRRWSREEVRHAVESFFRVVRMRQSVFTPGEEGSIAAWVTVMTSRS